MVVVRRVVGAAGQEADFTKDADIAARAGICGGGHLGVAVRVVRVLLVAVVAPEEEGRAREEGQKGEDANNDAGDGAARKTVGRGISSRWLSVRCNHWCRSDSFGDDFARDGDDSSTSHW